MQSIQLRTDLIPDIPGMIREPNPQGGINCRLSNGWVVTVRGNEGDPELLVFAGFRGGIRRLDHFIPIANPSGDDKRFLSPGQLSSLLTTIAALDNSGNVPANRD